MHTHHELVRSLIREIRRLREQQQEVNESLIHLEALVDMLMDEILAVHERIG